MRNSFDGNRVLSELLRMIDAMILGMLWLLCSVPIITIGASSAAFYYAYHETVFCRRGYAWKEFFLAFKENFKKATKLWSIVLTILVIALVDVIVVLTMGEAELLSGMFLVFAVAVFILVGAWALYVFPCIARFEMKLQVIMKYCAIIAFANLLWTILLLALFAGAVFAVMLMPGLILVLPAGYMFCANRILEHIFRKYMTLEDLKAQKDAAEKIKQSR